MKFAICLERKKFVRKDSLENMSFSVFFWQLLLFVSKIRKFKTKTKLKYTYSSGVCIKIIHILRYTIIHR
jgi:hypothetical protein